MEDKKNIPENHKIKVERINRQRWKLEWNTKKRLMNPKQNDKKKKKRQASKIRIEIAGKYERKNN